MTSVSIAQPARPRWRLRWLAIALAAGVTLWIAGTFWVGREPRFEGRTATEWLDAMGPIDSVTNVAGFREHPVRRQLAGAGPRLVSALEESLGRQARELASLRQRRFWKARLWSQASRILPRGFALPPPDPRSDREATAARRLQWSVAWMVDGSGDAEAGMDRLDRWMAAVPPNLAIEASLGFKVLRGEDVGLGQVLVRRLQSGERDPNRRAWWIACLGNLGEQPAAAADLVRSLAHDPHPGIRGESIKALGSVDAREDVVGFIRSCARDPAGRQAALIAFLRLGPRARPAEDFILEAHSDPDPLTRLFAQWARNAIGPAAAEPERARAE